MALAAAEALLAPVTAIDGFLLASLTDASTGMVLSAAQDSGDISVSRAAAGAADIASVLTLLTSELAAQDELEDVMITFSHHFHLIRIVPLTASQTVVLLVILDRGRANLAMARRTIRDFCASLAVA